MERRRAATTAVLAVLGATVVVLLLGWAATIGPADVLEGDGLEPVRTSETPTPTRTAPEDASAADPQDARAEPRPTHPWVGRVIAGVLLAGVGIGVGLLVRALVRAWHRRDRGVDEALPPPGAGEVLAPRDVAADLRADVAEQEDALAAGEPRDAIVACWHRFETTTAAAGARRQAWETPAEHVTRVLRTLGADEPATRRLADLYREARFSRHPMTEAHRADAATALAAVHASLGRVATR